KGFGITDFPVSPERLAGLVALREEDKISSSAMQTLLNVMVEAGSESDADAEALAREKNLLQVSDTGFLEPIVEEVLRENPEEVQRYLAGKEGLIGFFIGQIMKKSRGKANPGMVREMVQNKIREQA
ncbi:MAG: Asp-tRNA(Asn)/Glu-tRNA(Gln) amidotransferase subunit GatB, partial [Bacteroidota bacterium]